MNKIIIISLLGALAVGTVNAQTGINTKSTEASANLTVAPVDKNNTPKGTLLSAMTSAQRTAIASPATGLIVYDTDQKCLMSNNGTPAIPKWECIGGSSTTQSLSYFKQFHYTLASPIPMSTSNLSARSGPITTDLTLLSNWLAANDPTQVAELPTIDGIRADISFRSTDTYFPLIVNTNTTAKILAGITHASISGTYRWTLPTAISANGYLNIDNDLLLGWDPPNMETSVTLFRKVGENNGALYRVTFWGYRISNVYNIHILLEKFASQTGGVH